MLYPSRIKITHKSACTGVVHIPQCGEHRFCILLLSNHSQAVHFLAVLRGIAFRGAAGRESEQLRSVETDRGILHLRQGQLISRCFPGVLPAQHQIRFVAAACLLDKMAGYVHTWKTLSGAELCLERSERELLIRKQPSFHRTM